jgi:hypothetical protein
MARCAGLTKKNLPCKKVARGDGYCELHSPTSELCKGTTKEGCPCCQLPIPCLDGHCEFHYPNYPVCKGITRGCLPCCSKVVYPRFPSSEYCRDDHDPAFSRSTDPSIFRIASLRLEAGGEVAELRQNLDAYTRCKLSNFADLELDHVVELQCVRDCYDVVAKDHPDSKEKLAGAVRTTINLKENLNFTTKGINLLKYKATAAFLGAYKSEGGKDVGPGGITSFLLDAYSEEHEEKRLSRQVSAGIKSEIVKSYDAFVSEFEQDGKSHEDLCDKLHEMMIVGMKMK